MNVDPNVEHGTAVPKYKLDAADNTSAVITLAASAGTLHVIDWITVSFDKTLTTIGSLTVSINAVNVYGVFFSADAHSSGPFHFVFGDGKNGGLYGAKNQAVVITLTTGGAAVQGTLNAGTR
jgi:hypothetical protein